jgi:Mn2+/Fe2+ NRAMP family transporter
LKASKHRRRDGSPAAIDSVGEGCREKVMRRVRWAGWVVIVTAVIVGGVALALILTRGLSLLFGGVLLAAVAVTVLALCGRFPGQSFFGDSSPTRAHDSLNYP